MANQWQIFILGGLLKSKFHPEINKNTNQQILIIIYFLAVCSLSLKALQIRQG